MLSSVNHFCSVNLPLKIAFTKKIFKSANEKSQKNCSLLASKYHTEKDFLCRKIPKGHKPNLEKKFRVPKKRNMNLDFDCQSLDFQLRFMSLEVRECL